MNKRKKLVKGLMIPLIVLVIVLATVLGLIINKQAEYKVVEDYYGNLNII